MILTGTRVLVPTAIVVLSRQHEKCITSAMIHLQGSNISVSTEDVITIVGYGGHFWLLIHIISLPSRNWKLVNMQFLLGIEILLQNWSLNDQITIDSVAWDCLRKRW